MITEYFENTGLELPKEFNDNSLICLDTKLRVTRSGYSWKLGKCFGPRYFIGNGLYTDMCCLTAGEHTLTCKATENSGWVDSYFMLMGQYFCGNIVGYKSMSRINISGNPGTHIDSSKATIYLRDFA